MPHVEPRFKNTEWRRRAKVKRDAAELRAAKLDVLERSRGRCEARFVTTCTGYGIHLHHVVRRAQGGHNSPDNLLHVCNACHSAIHHSPEKARECGFLRSRGAR